MKRGWKRCLCFLLGGLIFLQTCIPVSAWSKEAIRDAYQSYNGSYTEEQKQMAKDWLRAHGYAPTMDGAYEAYADWLDGMWWDEIGSPDEIFGYDEEEEPTAAQQKDQPETRPEEESPTAATQKGWSDPEEDKEEERPAAEESGEGLLEEGGHEAGEEGPFGIFWQLSPQQIRILWDVQKYLPWMIPLFSRLAKYFPSLAWARYFDLFR